MVSFYQESGRAGRDQQPSTSVLYYGVDDHKKMQFILNNAESKKLQYGSPKKSLADFNVMVEYCETSGCRRKKILDCFGEQVSTSLCNKTCDACKHPNLVAKYLEELKTMCSRHNWSGSSQFISRSSNSKPVDEVEFSEYWHRDDEAIASASEEEDISDDGTDDVVALLSSKSKRLNKKMQLLQRAEDKYYYYHNRGPPPAADKQTNKVINQSTRESCKQRILNALNQAQLRLSTHLQIDPEKCCMFFEDECHKKYGKSGKSFYLSQVASTVRWLSTANAQDFTSRLEPLLKREPPEKLDKRKRLD